MIYSLLRKKSYGQWFCTFIWNFWVNESFRNGFELKGVTEIYESVKTKSTGAFEVSGGGSLRIYLGGTQFKQSKNSFTIIAMTPKNSQRGKMPVRPWLP